MAYFQLRGTRVSVFRSINGVQNLLPRNQTKHLDGEPLEVIREWVARWSNQHENRPFKVHELALPKAWLAHIKNFCQYLTDRGRQQVTTIAHSRHLHLALPFFIESGCKTFADFPNVSRKLAPWLLAKGKSPRRIWAINESVRMFWVWLDEVGLASGPLKLIGGLKKANPTPLKRTLTPDAVLAFKSERKDMRLFILIGYFFSLRPQEVIALRPIDFKAGTPATSHECSSVLAKAGLFSRLVVNIQRQKNARGEFTKPKAGSGGWVGCFHEQAAREIVSILADLDKDEPLFIHGLYWYCKLWKRYSIPDTVSKDMRRASLYWLGHYSELPVTALKNHARHWLIETTMLYTRRPEESSEHEWAGLTLDD